jgi:PBP1b-binding outer membrane lipoprotein LpoB
MEFFMKKKLVLSVMPAFLLALALAFTGCDSPVHDTAVGGTKPPKPVLVKVTDVNLTPEAVVEKGVPSAAILPWYPRPVFQR